MDDLLMFFLLGCIGYIMYRGITGKPILPFLANRKKKDTDQRSVKKIKELKRLKGHPWKSPGVNT